MYSSGMIWGEVDGEKIGAAVVQPRETGNCCLHVQDECEKDISYLSTGSKHDYVY
jgi:hypothetical protein